MVVMSLQDGEIRLRPIGVVLAEAQAMVAPYVRASGDSVERFLADKRAEVAREELEYQPQPHETSGQETG